MFTNGAASKCIAHFGGKAPMELAVRVYTECDGKLYGGARIE
jgi:hypothetical protein